MGGGGGGGGGVSKVRRRIKSQLSKNKMSDFKEFKLCFFSFLIFIPVQ